jgi:hypothetical protein
MAEKLTRDEEKRRDLKRLLMDKYRDLILEKLTTEDLDELRYYLSRQYDTEHGWNAEYRRRFELKLAKYMHEEIMRREIAGIETLLPLLTHRDLKRKGS